MRGQERQEREVSVMLAPVLIAHTDSRLRSMLRGVLEDTGRAVMEATDPESALATLRASERGMVVLFDVALFSNTLTGGDSVTLLGAATHDRRLTKQHAFVVITPTPENVAVVFGRMLERIGAPIVAEPVDTASLRRAIIEAERPLLVTA